MSASPRPESGAVAADAKRSDLPARVAAGAVLMVLALSAVWAGFYWFMTFWLIAAILVNWEWQSMIGRDGRVYRVAVGSVALAAAALLSIDGRTILAIVAVGVGAGLAALAGDWRKPWASGGVLYAGAMLVAICALRASEPYGARVVLWLFALVWGADIMAYFGGRLIGGPKLWPRISPGKTWSGFFVGIACGAALGTLFARGLGSAPALFAVGVAGAAVSQGGDLFESAIKRRFGVKDSSRLIPGHGGVMDRLDGFIAAAVFAAALGLIRGGGGQAAQGVLQW
ncbi:MAG TPA: phosphatidate cytidylyltransferase [Roseiarcus sp.]|nr:phosphatidate cytidylyltransferase [Roseiarcus sp.]